ncbi:MAG: glycogen debranching protein [Microcystis aeruginosa Ma_MB_S_20031200_S102]|uniref:Glycogen debranching protein n=1 Tax=Microcystis aeruginosa Ma_MB_S_20031200_S102 TaxID=2486254 RepID=A0A552F2U0_MICAE|nr:MAG: glycogen debranching protein [Microcystis aeruginosa Ma_MB_S_20031200_S102D]TRU41040.1 MAG: glycogen debranching protein [Microcystis aeruginosa Ma_MB_S_20031200_S102]
MVKLRFGRDICNYLPVAEKCEWLVTNGIGGFAAGTVAGLLTRCYHGLLIAALAPPTQRTLLVTKIDESLQYNQKIYHLASNRWLGATIEPQGYINIESFHLEGTIPVWTFICGDALLEKRIWMEQGENTTYTRYTYLRGNSPLTLNLTAFVNYRDFHGNTQSFNWQMDISPLEKGVRVIAYNNAVPFYLLISQGEVFPAHIWYYRFDLAVERYRGLIDRENHLHAASFSATLKVGESVTIAASTRPDPSLDGQSSLESRHRYESSLINPQHPEWIQQLTLAADQFIVSRPLRDQPDGKTIIAGYPWFGDWGRDTMISLRGLTLTTGRPAIAREILLTFSRYLDRGLLPNLLPDGGEMPEYNAVDAILWYFEAIRSYFNQSQDFEFLRTIYPALTEVIAWFRRGTRYNIHLDDDGLIYAGETGVQLTWMDAKVDDLVITPRIGKPVEINALWFNALKIMVQFAHNLGMDATDYEKMRKMTLKGFSRFWDDSLGYCYDVLDTDKGNDASLRPNQLFALSLSVEELLNSPQKKAIVDICTVKLLTPRGLRSLDADHPDYRGVYSGDRVKRDSAYHQGTVWGWLLGAFIEAHLKVYRDPILAESFLTPMIDHLRDSCIGNLSEIFDGNAPFTPRGAFAQAWTVAEVLRVWQVIREFRP